MKAVLLTDFLLFVISNKAIEQVKSSTKIFMKNMNVDWLWWGL